MKLGERLSGMVAAYKDLALKSSRNSGGMLDAAAALATANKRLPDMVIAEVVAEFSCGALAKRVAEMKATDIGDAEVVVEIVREYIERLADKYTDTVEQMRFDATRTEGMATAFASVAKSLQHAIDTASTPGAIDAAEPDVVEPIAEPEATTTASANAQP